MPSKHGIGRLNLVNGRYSELGEPNVITYMDIIFWKFAH